MTQKHHASFKSKVVAAITVIFFLIGLGTIVYNLIEHWSVIDSVYFTVMTLTTIGYGDLVPTHTSSKIFTIFFAFSGIGVVLFAMMTIVEHYFTERTTVMEKKFRKFSVKAIERFSPDLKEPVSRRGFFKKMPIMTKADLRAKRVEIKKKKILK